MASSKSQRVLISQPIHDAGIRLLKDKGYEARVSPDTSEATYVKEIRDCSGLLVRTAEIPASVIEAGKSLKVIARHGVGYDNINVAAATRRRIPVCITPRANALSVAEHVLTLMLTLAKRIVPYDSATRRNDWEVRNSYGAIDLNGKVLGILGMGRIGSLVCRKSKAAFDMEVLAYDPLIPAETMQQAGAKVVKSIPELLKAADVVTVHVPSSPQTKGLIGVKELAMMKPTAFLINTARGPLVDEAALVKALIEKRIAGAGLDVFDPEPPKADNPLYALPNVVLTPHSAGLTVECVIRMATHAAQAIIDILEGRRPEGVINPEVFD
ncbi:MAG TPA: hydroxyacid dehydrogenase [Candidatus Methylomirabilis sp.]|nr:hydroxyacid dehydrogenase [Candidatus Methylomirabilis sp.]